MQGPQDDRGMGLPTVLMAAALMLVLGFTVAAVAFNHLNVSSRLTNAQYAKNLAEAAAARGIDEVMYDKSYGYAPDSNNNTTVTFNLYGAPPTAQGRVTFDKSKPYYSFNNLNSTDQTYPVVCAGQQVNVPPQTAFIVGTGTCNGVVRRVETLVHIPKFPFVIASSGPINSNGGLFVSGIKDPSLLDSGQTITKADLVPGSLVTDSSVGGSALKLSAPASNPSHITGYAQSASGAKITGNTTVDLGERLGPKYKVPIPKINITQYDDSGKTGVYDIPSSYSSDPTKPTVVGGYAYDAGSLNVYGGLQLNGGVLYVNGDLNVSGGISGKGAVIVTGSTTINGGGNLATDNQAAVLSGGDINITGTSGSNAVYKGLMYTEGNLTSDNMQLEGAFIANGNNSTTTMNNTKLYQVPIDTKIAVKGSPTGSVTEGAPAGSTTTTTSTTTTSSGSPWQPPPSPYKVTRSVTTASGTVAFEYQLTAAQAVFNSSSNRYTFTSPLSLGTGPGTYSVTVVSPPPGFSPTTYTSLNSLQAAIKSYEQSKGVTLSSKELTNLTSSLSSARGYTTYLSTYVYPNDQAYETTHPGQPSPHGWTNEPPSGGGGGGGGTKTLFSIDLSNFTQYYQQMRILYWRELDD